MRIEPSYVLESPRSLQWSRRALLRHAVTALAGAGAGSLLLGLALRGGTGAAQLEQPQAHDPTLAWLLALCADDATPGALLQHHEALLYLVPRAYPEQDRLWRGIERLARTALDHPDLPGRAELVRDLSECLASHARSAGRVELLALVPALLAADEGHRDAMRKAGGR